MKKPILEEVGPTLEDAEEALAHAERVAMWVGRPRRMLFKGNLATDSVQSLALVGQLKALVAERTKD